MLFSMINIDNSQNNSQKNFTLKYRLIPKQIRIC